MCQLANTEQAPTTKELRKTFSGFKREEENFESFLEARVYAAINLAQHCQGTAANSFQRLLPEVARLKSSTQPLQRFETQSSITAAPECMQTYNTIQRPMHEASHHKQVPPMQNAQVMYHHVLCVPCA